MVKLPFESIVLEMEGMLGVAPSCRPIESPGPSRSIADDEVPSLLLCLRCLLEDAVVGRDMDDEAPGPGVVLGGAAAMGTTPLPPTMVAPPYWLPGVLPAV